MCQGTLRSALRSSSGRCALDTSSIRSSALQAGFARLEWCDSAAIVTLFKAKVSDMRLTKGKTNKRKKYAPEYKAGLVLEIVSGKRTVAEIARTEKIKDSVLYEWRNDVIAKLPLLFAMDLPAQRQNERENELEQLIGQLTIENQALKKASF